MRGQIAWRHQVDRHAQQLLQFILQATQIEKRSPRHGVNEQIKIAALGIVAPQGRAKHPRVGCSKARSRATNRVAVVVKSG